jgi:hypothetical protein
VNRTKLKLAFAVLALSPALSWALPGDGLLGTDHDFTVGSPSPGVSATAVGLCTYCHTPHKALSTLLLWNHTLSTNNFSWDVPSTTAGTVFPTIAGSTYKGPTAKCLSCHDGSVAVGDIAWFMESAWPGGTAATGDLAGSTTSTWQMSSEPSHQVGAGGNMAGNHPVAMPYPFNNTANTYNGTTNGAALTTNEWQADPSLLAQASIRLFNDDGSGNISAGTALGKTGIECSTCHDPHNKAAKDDMFLRGMLTGNQQTDGYICLQCHKK